MPSTNRWGGILHHPNRGPNFTNLYWIVNMALASHNHMPSVCIEHEKKTHEHDFMAQAFMANLHWSETLCASSVSAENDYYSPHKKEQHSSRPNHAISTDELQGLYARVIKRGKLGNPRTKWRFIARKTIELNGEISRKPCLITRG